MVTYDVGSHYPSNPYPLKIDRNTGDISFEAVEGAVLLGDYSFYLTVTAFAGVFQYPYMVQYQTAMVVEVTQGVLVPTYSFDQIFN